MIIKKEGQLKRICLIKNNTLLTAGMIFLSITLLGCQKKHRNTQSDEVKNEELKWEWLIGPEEYEDLFFIDHDLLAVQEDDGKYSIINTKKKRIGNDLYDEIFQFQDQLALVKKDKDYYFTDREGNRLSDDSYEEAYSFHDGIAAVKKNNKWGYINKTGKVIKDCQFEQVNNFKEDMAAVKSNNKWGFIDNSGNNIIPCEYDMVKDFNETRAAVMKNNKWGFIDISGKRIADCEYDSVNDFQEGYAGVMKSDKWGFINKGGEICIGLKYEEAANFSEGKAAVKVIDYQDGLDEWAYIDRIDHVVIDYYPYDASEGRLIWVGEFKDDIAFVSKTLYCIINDKGNNVFSGDSRFFISTPVYYSVHDAVPCYLFADDKMTVKKYGLMGLRGDQRLEPVFDYIQGVYGDYVIVENVVNDEYQKGVIQIFK